MILALETSGELGSIACLRKGEVCGGQEFSARQEACRRLPPTVLELLAARALAVAELQAIAVSRGPGSFNGLRVGLAFAKAFAHALRLPALGIPTPLAWAHESSTRRPEAAVAVLQPVRRDFLYLTVYAPGAAEPVSPTAAVAEESWQESTAALAGKHPLLLTGNWPGLETLTALPFGWDLDAERRASPAAATIALLAWPLLEATSPDSAFTLRPEYLSPSQAERMRGVDLGL